MKEKYNGMRQNIWPVLFKSTAIAALALGYAASVSHWITRDIVSSDRHGCLGPHIVTAWAMGVLGMGAALVLVPTVERLVQGVMAAFLPHQSSALRWQIARTLAAAFLIGNALAGLIWTSPRLDLFVDLHRPLRTESDVLIMAMGLAGGTAWRTLWPRWAWLGVGISIFMTYIVLANTLTRHAWC